MAAGVVALKIEGRQRGRAYVKRIVAAFRRAVEAAARGERLPPSEIAALSEGGRETLGAYRKTWQ
jgi:putative protease